MFNSRFHIAALAKYLNKILPSSVIGDIFTFRKDEFHITLRNCKSIEDIHCNFRAPLPYMTFEEQAPRPKRKVAILKELAGISVVNVRWHPSDRQLLIELQHDMGYLLFLLYGINGNVFYLNKNLEVVDSFKKSRSAPELSLADFTSSDIPPVAEPAFRQLLTQHPDKAPIKFFPLAPLSIYSQTLIREICHRNGIGEKTLTANLTNPQIQQLFQEYSSISAEIIEKSAYVYETDPPLFSLVKLLHLSGLPFRKFESVAEATRFFISHFYQTNVFSDTRRFMLRRLQNNLHLLQHKLAKQEKELAKLPTADVYRNWADTILANLHRIDKHLSSITLPKLDNPDEDIAILLNPKLTATENANKYYEKSKIARKSREQLKQTIETTGNSIKRIAVRIREVESCQDLKTLRNIKTSIPKELLKQKAAADVTARLPYYSFTTGKYTILIGKSAKDNDLLSFKHARPNDFWFHAEHGPGSHVIVPNPTRQESLPNNIIETAAGIAAFYSKAKHSGVAPVIYTKRKYIWKRKDMPPGRVFTKFTKSVIVKPVAPKFPPL